MSVGLGYWFSQDQFYVPDYDSEPFNNNTEHLRCISDLSLMYQIAKASYSEWLKWN